MLAFDSLTVEENFAFSLDEKYKLPNYINSSIIELAIFYDKDVHTIQRSVYNSFQLFGDVGGVFGLLFSLASTILNIINF